MFGFKKSTFKIKRKNVYIDNQIRDYCINRYVSETCENSNKDMSNIIDIIRHSPVNEDELEWI